MPDKAPPGRALTNAKVHVMDRPDHVETAILWEGDTITLVGDDETIATAAQAKGIPIEDLDGRVVLPGFVDAHTHFLHVGVKKTRPDLRGCTSKEEALTRVRDWLAAHPGTHPVIGEGWDESHWTDPVRPTLAELDEATRDAPDGAGGTLHRPFVFRRIDGHIAIGNSAVLPTLRAHWDDDGLVDMQTGILLEEASLYLNEIIPSPPEELDEAVVEACRVAHRLGVTAVGDYSQAPYRAALQRAAATGRLTVRTFGSIYVQQMEAEILAGFHTGRRAMGPEDAATECALPGESLESEGPGASSGDPSHAPTPTAQGHRAIHTPRRGGNSPWLRDGGLKVFHDGSFGGHTAWLHEPYEGKGDEDGKDGCGRPIWSDADTTRIYMRAHKAGIQLHAHAIGDAAIDQSLDGMQQLQGIDRRLWYDPADPTGRANKLRHRIEHYELPTDAAVGRTAKLGVVASCQPNFVGSWSKKGGMYEERLGERFWRNNRYISWKKQGVRVAFGSDGMPFGPLVGIQAAVAHPVKEERLTAAEAVWHYTREAAWSIHWEDAIGTLQVGKKADLLVLDLHDLDSAAPEAWPLVETVAGGRRVYANAD